MPTFHLDASRRHLAWDHALPPALVVAPGDEVEVATVDASGGQLSRTDGAEAVARLDFAAVNPCTGPIVVEGARVGDDLIVELLEVATGDWAWTANIPGFGLLADDFPDAALWISEVRGARVVTPIGVEIPLRAMVGTIGVAKAEPGPTPLLVPTLAGGNMDVAQLGAGATLRLPIQVPGAMLSLGDLHAVQGDGEVCGTAAETPGAVRLRVSTAPSDGASPRFSHAAVPLATEWVATTGIGPDLFAAAREATRRAVELLSSRTRIDPVDAYLLSSLVGELRVSEIVDAPNWVVSMHLPAWLLGATSP